MDGSGCYIVCGTAAMFCRRDSEIVERVSFGIVGCESGIFRIVIVPGTRLCSSLPEIVCSMKIFIRFS